MDIFGVANDTLGVQDNYLLAEGHWPAEKNSNSVLSMLHNSLSSADLRGKQKLYLVADNCSGQNKNMYVMWYLAWLAATSTFPDIRMQFLIAGHTKNLCDSNFGVLKRSLKGQDVCCIQDACRLVTALTKCNRVITAAAVKLVRWKEFLAQFFSGAIPMITQQHVMHFTNDSPGHVFFKALSTSSEGPRCNLFKGGITLDHLLNPTFHGLHPLETFLAPATTLPDTRKKYLVDKIVEPYLIGKFSPVRDLFFASQ